MKGIGGHRQERPPRERVTYQRFDGDGQCMAPTREHAATESSRGIDRWSCAVVKSPACVGVDESAPYSRGIHGIPKRRERGRIERFGDDAAGG